MTFEVVVRSVVLPNIRPPRAQVLPAEDNPEQGMVTIKGSDSDKIGASRNWTVSVTHDMPQKETKRQYNVERVHQVDEKGNINNNNYVDVERLKKVRVEGAEGPFRYHYADPPERPNVKVLEADVERVTPG